MRRRAMRLIYISFFCTDRLGKNDPNLPVRIVKVFETLQSVIGH